MTRYLISFDDGAMTIPEVEMPDVAEAAQRGTGARGRPERLIEATAAVPRKGRPTPPRHARPR